MVFVISLFLAASGIGADLKVAVFKSDSVLPFEEILSGFKAELQQRNFDADVAILTEGKEPKHYHDQIARIRPNIILCLGSKALQQASLVKGVPKIFSLVTYRNAQSWSDREDITGIVIDLAPALQFRVMRQVFPESRRIGVLYDPDENQKIIEEAKKIAATMGLHLLSYPVHSIRDIPLAFQQFENKVDILWALYDPTAYSPESAKYILMQSLRKRIPLIGFSPHFAKAGAPLALYGDYRDMGRQAALQAIALSRGEAILIRTVRPRTVRMAVNEKVGQLMGITFPPDLMKMVHQSY